jgi:hypothetical protein
VNNLISPTLLMKKPNERKVIFNGFCELISNNESIHRKVKIYYEWIPNIVIKASIKEVPFKFAHSNTDRLIIKGPNFNINNFFITNITGLIDADIIGIVNGSFKKGEIKPKEKIFKIEFSLFNLRNYFGSNIYFENSKGKHWTRGELHFFSKNTELIIHKYFKDDIQRNLLSKYGGFLSTHGGCLIFSRGINKEDYHNYVNRLGVFFSFINGRRCYPNFIRIYNEKNTIIQKDFTPYFVDVDKSVSSWIPHIIDSKFQDLWPKFLERFENPEDFEKIDLIIHWYLEALNNSGFINGSIILIQNSFELLFNWIFNEKKIIISNESLDKLRASDKIRLLLDKFNIDFNLPEIYLEKYKEEIKKDVSLKDFSYQFTEMRNHFVHFKKSKKSKIITKPEEFSWALLNTSIFNLEQIILKILGYDGKIKSRVHTNMWRGTNEIDLLP